MFCPACGLDVSNEAEFCPHCGEKLEKARNLLSATPVISDISESESKSISESIPEPESKSEVELSLEGDTEVLHILPNTVNKFYLIIFSSIELK